MDHSILVYEGYDHEHEPLREALCTLGNGFFATRGAHESTQAGDIHYPGTYMAGGYDRLESDIHGQVIENEDFVNWPNWLYLTFRHPDEEQWFSPETVELLDYHQRLDLRRGLLMRRSRFRDTEGRETLLESRRFVHMRKRHLAAIEWRLTPQNWSGDIQLRSALDGTVTNSGVARYRALNGNHLEPLRTGRSAEDTIFLEVQTRQSHIRMAQAARTMVHDDGQPLPVERSTREARGYVEQELRLRCAQHHTVTIEKTVAVHTSRDFGSGEPVEAASVSLREAPSFNTLVATQEAAWQHLWYRCDIDLEGDGNTQLLLHLHIFHLLQTASMNSIDRDTGVPPRGLHGEAYRGHIMWDELFIFPFLNLRIPVLTRAFLMYRYRRLDAARTAAVRAGFQGAMYPWQSGSSGKEESQKIHLNPRSGRWVSDNTQLQRHVNVAIAYSIWQYYQVTEDKEFLYFFGAEMILEIARFWASRARFNPERGRFEIRGIVGPDEYHTRYPDSDQPGIDNNAYTNFMAAWVLRRARDVLRLLDEHRQKELCGDLGIDAEELNRWDQMVQRMFIPFHDEGVIEQFEGYGQLDWEYYRGRYGDNMRLDRILESEDDSVNRYQASKQADVLMLFYLFSSEEIQEHLQRMGYSFDHSAISRTIDYYHNRTSHGSTLSRLVFSWVLSRADRKRSWHLYEKALVSDFSDVQGGTTPEGIHLGAMAGTVDMMQRCYTGLEVRDDVLWLNPRLPENVDELRMRFRYRSHWIMLKICCDKMTVNVEEGWGNPIQIGVAGTVEEIRRKQTKTFALDMNYGPVNK